MKTDEQAESSRRLEEYRLRHERAPEPIHLEDFEDLGTILKIQSMFTRHPEKARKVLK